MNKKEMNAVLLEKILILAVVALLAVTVAAYVLLSNFTKTQAVSANHSAITAESSQKDIDSLQKSYVWMEFNPRTVDKTNKIVAEASQYKYQDQAILDIEAIAKQAGIETTQYSFAEATAAAPTGTAAPSTAPAPTAGTSSASSTSGTPTDLVPSYIGIKLSGNVQLDKLLLFLKKIEQNVTRMQITSLSLKPDSKDPSMVTMETLNISILLNKGAQE